LPSLSEWGCIENRPREFEELGALMSDKMTSVYSGGLMYEYSLEDNNYGIVDIKDGKVNHEKEFKLFKEALEKYPTPTGDGGAAKETHGVDCPSKKGKSWQIDSVEIPAIPKEAEQYMKDGAGEGPGLKGPGSQTAGDSGTSTEEVTGGEPSPTGESSEVNEDGDEDAAISLSVGMLPMLVTGGTIFFAMFGGALL
jgi:hypothetical protein